MISTHHICGEEELLNELPLTKHTVTCTSMTGEAYSIKKKHLLKYFQIDPSSKLKMERFSLQKGKLHSNFFSLFSDQANKHHRYLKKKPEISLSKPSEYSLPNLTTLTSKSHQKDLFNFDTKSVEFLTNNSTTNTQENTLPTEEGEEKLAFSHLLKPLESPVHNKKFWKKISSFENVLEKRIVELYPAFEKYPAKNIQFLKNYLGDLKEKYKQNESEQVVNVKEKLSKMKNKSIKEKIQQMKKLFMFYSIKKKDLGDISKENIKGKFVKKDEDSEDVDDNLMEQFYNFKLPKDSKILKEIIMMAKKKEKFIDIDTIRVDKTPVLRKQNKSEWSKAEEITKANKKNYYSLKYDDSNNMKISRIPYCE